MADTSYITWKKNNDLSFDKGFSVREGLAQNAAKKGFNAIIDEYVYIYPENIKRTFQLLPRAEESFKGKGVDLGGGVGCISATIALRDEVESLYCVEFAEDVVKLCQPVVKEAILKEKKDKVISVVGDFDNFELDDHSLDFAVDWDSLHHSHGPVKTLQECRRVLKPGGRLVMVDRAHNNSTPDAEIERMHNIVYDKAFLRRNYLDENLTIKRKELGEHEWRFREWDKFFAEAGFRLLDSVVIKTDTAENRGLKNDNGLVEIFTGYNLGGFGHRKVGWVLESA